MVARLFAAGGRRRAERWLSASVSRFARDDRGQDLIEYALLTAGVALAGAAMWPVIVTSIGTAYSTLDFNTQGLWNLPDP